MEESARIRPSMWRAKEYHADSRVDNVVKMDKTVLVGVGLTEHLLDDDTAQTVGYEYEGPRRIFPTRRLQHDQEVVRYVVEVVRARRRPSPVAYLGVVAVSHNPSGLKVTWEHILRPVRAFRLRTRPGRGVPREGAGGAVSEALGSITVSRFSTGGFDAGLATSGEPGENRMASKPMDKYNAMTISTSELKEGRREHTPGRATAARPRWSARWRGSHRLSLLPAPLLGDARCFASAEPDASRSDTRGDCQMWQCIGIPRIYRGRYSITGRHPVPQPTTVA